MEADAELAAVIKAATTQMLAPAATNPRIG